MGITIAQIQDAKLRELAAKVDGSFEGETKGNKILDDCEMGIFASQVKSAGLEAEYEEFLKIHKQTQAAGKEFDVNMAATEQTRLEANIQKAEKKVANLREKLAEIENRPESAKKEKCKKIGGGIGAGIGTALGLTSFLIAEAGFLPAFAVITLGGAGALIGAGVGLGVYYLTRSKDKEKAYSENNKNEYAQTQAALKAAEQELQQSKLELQHFMNNL